MKIIQLNIQYHSYLLGTFTGTIGTQHTGTVPMPLSQEISVKKVL